MTLVFVLVYAPLSAGILVAFTLLIYFMTSADRVAGWRAVVAAAVIVAVLGFYKVRVSAAPADVLRDVAIPLGLSYYSFRCLHYLIERYKGTIGHPSLTQLVCYLFFLPTIVVGPIHRFGPFLRDLRRKRWDSQMLSEGLERILYGYVKIAFLANYLVSKQIAIVIAGIDPENLALIYYLEIVRNGLNIYLQFSGFSDIAIGFALLLGYRVMENFNWPYFKKNISEFWRAWHISLTSWCREYIYNVVLSITRSPVLGVVATMVVIGLWHEVSFRYLLWGLYHGIGIAIWQQFQKIKKPLPDGTNIWLRRSVDGLSILFNVHFVWFGFVVIWQPDPLDALRVFKTVLFFWL